MSDLAAYLFLLFKCGGRSFPVFHSFVPTKYQVWVLVPSFSFCVETLQLWGGVGVTLYFLMKKQSLMNRITFHFYIVSDYAGI